MNDKELAELEAKDYNESVGDLEGFNCDICKNKGYIEKVKEVSGRYYNYVVECKCMRKRKIIARAQNSGLGDYLKKRFDDYLTGEKWQEEVKTKAIEFVKTDNDYWFIMAGQSGSGKTLLCSIIANMLLGKGKVVMYVTWTDFISKLKRDMMGDKTQEVSQYFEDIKTVEVLFIDELLKKYTEADLKYIIEIINYRYSNNLKTIISSEREIVDLLSIDEATIGRMVEKAGITGRYVINIPKDMSRNYRLKGVLGQAPTQQQPKEQQWVKDYLKKDDLNRL